MTTKVLALALAATVAAGVQVPVHGQSRVGIRETYLRGLKSETVWEAAKTVTTPLLEIVVTQELACPSVFEGKESPYRVDTPENRMKLLNAAKNNGCEIVAFCTGINVNSLGSNVDWIRKAAQAAADMKVPVIMMPLGGGTDQADFLQKSLAFVKAVAPVARETKVQLAVENLGPYLNKEEVLKPLMEAVPNDEVGLALDITNMYWFGYPPARIYELAKTFAPHVRYCHAKNIKYPPEDRERQRQMGWQYGKYAEPVRTGDLDFEKVLGFYFQAGFKGNIVIEDDSLGKFDAAGKIKVIQDDAVLLRNLIAKLQK